MWATDETTTINFENNAIPTGWTNTNAMAVVDNPISSSSATHGSYSLSTNGKANCSLTSGKIDNVKSISIDATKTSGNNATNLYIDFSPKSDFSSDVQTENVTNIPQNSWATSTLTLTSTASGYVRIRWAGSSTAIKYIDNIVITYVVDNRTAVNITSFTADATTIQIGNTVNTTVAVDQGGWTESYEYESDDTDIATVDTDGKITAVAAGTATITVSLNMNPSDANYKAGATTSKEIEITVVENPVHTATLNINGQTSVQDVAEGSAISFPSISGLGGLNFLGWTTDPIVGKASVAPAVLVTSANMGNADITYYAVFGKTAIITDVLNRETTEVTNGSSSYSNWSGKTASSDAIYAGNSAGGNNSIQLRSNNNNSGVVTTTSGGKVKKVTVNWNSNTANDRTLNVYGKNTAYESASDLYDNTTQGTLIGTIVKGTSTELTISTDYEYIGVRSASNAMYLSDLSITWNTGGDNEYCTSVTETITINAACNDGAGNYYGTYSSSSAFVVPSDLVVSEISVVDGKLYVDSYNTGDVVPANTGVMVAALAGGNYDVNLSAEAGTSVLGNDNMLKPSGDAGIDAEAMATAAPSCKYYRLTMHNGTTLGFYWGAASGAAFDLAANKAYLAVPAGSPAPEFFGFGGDVTGIDAVNGSELKVNGEYYNLAGQRVANPTKGLYIVNGKKVVIK